VTATEARRNERMNIFEKATYRRITDGHDGV